MSEESPYVTHRQLYEDLQELEQRLDGRLDELKDTLRDIRQMLTIHVKTGNGKRIEDVKGWAKDRNWTELAKWAAIGALLKFNVGQHQGWYDAWLQ